MTGTPGQPQHTPRRRSTLRRWIAPIACLLIGMVLSIVSGWVCVLFMPLRDVATDPPLASIEWIATVPRGWPQAPDSQQVISGLGWVGTSQVRLEGDTGDFDHYWLAHLTAGFPFKSAADCHLSIKLRSSPRRIALDTASFAPSIPSWIPRPHDVIRGARLPVIPLLPGFALNTLIYAALAWCILFAPGHLRRRRRLARHQCPACAYPIGTTTICTECGEPITPRATTS